jgi:hypothetical protein
MVVPAERKRKLTRRARGSHGDGAALGPRIVIIDNDETTGSYGPLFDILDLLKHHETEIKKAGMRVRDLVPKLVAFCYKAGLFRPGLRDLLVGLWGLREKHLLDAIVMYTYQSEAGLRSAEALYDATGQQLTVPVLLDYMFGYIANGCKKGGPLVRFFDLRIVRETHMRMLGRKDSALGAKKISLVFDLLQRQPSADLRGLVFIDDCLPNVRMPARIDGEEVVCGQWTGLSVIPFEFETSMVAGIGEAYLGLWNSLLRGLVGREEFDDFINQSIAGCLETAGEGGWPGCSSAREKPVYGQIDFAPLARRLKGHFVGLK